MFGESSSFNRTDRIICTMMDTLSRIGVFLVIVMCRNHAISTSPYDGMCVPIDAMIEYPQHYLNSYNFNVLTGVMTRQECINACYVAKDYICRSAEFVNDFASCRHSLTNAKEKPGRLISAISSDYLERRCASDSTMVNSMIGTSFGLQTEVHKATTSTFMIYATAYSIRSTTACAVWCSRQAKCQYFAYCATELTCHLAETNDSPNNVDILTFTNCKVKAKLSVNYKSNI